MKKSERVEITNLGQLANFMQIAATMADRAIPVTDSTGTKTVLLVWFDDEKGELVVDWGENGIG